MEKVKEPSREEQQADAVRSQSQAGAMLADRLPPEFTSAIQSASPEAIAQLIGAHPQLTDPIFWTVQTLRGNGFAQQVLAIGPTAPPQHEGEVPVANEPAPAVPQAPVLSADTTTRPANDHDRDMQKQAAWNAMSRGLGDSKHAWQAVRLPPEVVQAVDHYWQESTKDGNEHGGLIYKTTIRGRTGVHEGHDYNEGEMDTDAIELGHFEDALGGIHTHPEPDAPEHQSCFSDGDFRHLVGADREKVMIMRSGATTYMIARTRQFDAMLEQRIDGPDTQAQVEEEMVAVYNAAFDATQDGAGGPKGYGPRWNEAGERAVFAVCQKFGLLFYKGSGSDLQLVTSDPAAKVTDPETYGDYVATQKKHPDRK